MINDDVTCPLHYAGDGEVECKRAMRSMMHGVDLPAYLSGWWYAAFKYLWRWPHKGRLKDLRKARESLDNLIAAVEEEEAWKQQ